MQLNPHDMAVIEQALREAINQGADYHKISTYQSVLGKLQEYNHADPVARRTANTALDGFRYDYDDSVDVL
ncbi:hypothetical protein [Paenibacillus alkalitolerans]|uniref:hypothetical protein n=1 Tax=Paenibacillus alkalitolerans TaxID=2799335 RepID=UPI0018F60968|nr:hypothetical protein [Paenibacillus alkalitolerans]